MIKVDLKTVALPLFPLTESARISLEYYRQRVTSQEQARIRYICNSTSNEVGYRINRVLSYDTWTPSVLSRLADEIISSYGLHGWIVVDHVLKLDNSLKDKVALLKNDDLIDQVMGAESRDRIKAGNSLRLRWVNELLAQKV